MYCERMKEGFLIYIRLLLGDDEKISTVVVDDKIRFNQLKVDFGSKDDADKLTLNQFVLTRLSRSY